RSLPGLRMSADTRLWIGARGNDRRIVNRRCVENHSKRNRRRGRWFVGPEAACRRVGHRDFARSLGQTAIVRLKAKTLKSNTALLTERTIPGRSRGSSRNVAQPILLPFSKAAQGLFARARAVGEVVEEVFL